MAFLGGFLLVLFILTAVLLVIIVLLQDEAGEGFGGIFGGGGAAPVGNRSGNIMTRATSIIATVFLLSLFGYAWINRTPENANVEAAARALEAENGDVLEWWLVDEDTLGDNPAAVTDDQADEPALEAAPAPSDEESQDTN
jgi:preprotein translocase subunit SecG